MKINDFSDKKAKGGSKGPIGQTGGNFGKPVAVSTVGPDPSKNKDLGYKKTKGSKTSEKMPKSAKAKKLK